MKLLIIINVLLSFFFLSCGKAKYHCGETAGVERSGVGISFYSVPNSKYMYTNVPFYSLYNKDSLVIRDQDGVKISLLISSNIDNKDPNNPIGYYIFGLTPIYNSSTDAVAFNQEVTKKFYMQYNSTEKDTLTCIFKAKRNECNSYFEYLKVYYKNNLIGSSNYITCDVTINKP
jgi:hypothetical protein